MMNPYTQIEKELRQVRATAGSQMELHALDLAETVISTLSNYKKGGITADQLEQFMENLKAEFAGGIWDNGVATKSSPITPTIVRIFSSHYRDKFQRDYVPTTYDTRAIGKEIVPYLRTRSENKSAGASKIWETIVANYLHSDMSKSSFEASRGFLLRGVVPYLQELERGSLGELTTSSYDGQRIFETFRDYAPAGVITDKDIDDLLKVCNNSLPEAVGAIEWFMTTTDSSVPTKPYTLSFITRHYDLYEAFKKKSYAQNKAKAKAGRELQRQLKTLLKGKSV